MSDTALLALILGGMALSLGFGIWAGLGYPWLYDKYEESGKADRRTPFERIVDWLVKMWDR